MEQPPPQQPLPMDPMATNVGYIPQQRFDTDSVMSKHLDATEMLLKLKYMLLGYEYNDEEDEWKAVMVTIGYDKDGKEIRTESDPLMPERTVRTVISSLEMYLSANTFLSDLREESRNDIMYGVCQNLAIIWFRLGSKVQPEERAVIHSTIKDAIFLGLSRAENKITLNAVSKMQQTHEIIQGGPQKTPTQDKEFKVLGW